MAFILLLNPTINNLTKYLRFNPVTLVQSKIILPGRYLQLNVDARRKAANAHAGRHRASVASHLALEQGSTEPKAWFSCLDGTD